MSSETCRRRIRRRPTPELGSATLIQSRWWTRVDTRVSSLTLPLCSRQSFCDGGTAHRKKSRDRGSEGGSGEVQGGERRELGRRRGHRVGGVRHRLHKGSGGPGRKTVGRGEEVHVMDSWPAIRCGFSTTTATSTNPHSYPWSARGGRRPAVWSSVGRTSGVSGSTRRSTRTALRILPLSAVP